MSKKDYKVTVITPFHNVDMLMFKEAYRSMLDQTIGFSNIEWIVVLHNCTPEYMPMVKEMIGKHENVVLMELNNDRHSASSPRNHGMKYANAPYIGFLDGDDTYSLDCLERALYYANKHEVDMAIFRLEYEMENDLLIPQKNITLWNQLEEEIVITRDTWNDEKMFIGLSFFVTTRLFKTETLRKHNLCYDESVPFGEDLLFTLTCYDKMQKYVFMPQLVGYKYNVNAGSTVQNLDKSKEELMRMINGVVTIMEQLLSMGCYFSGYATLCLFCICQYIRVSDKLSMDDRMEIKRILAPYINILEPIKANKVYSENEAQMQYNMINEIIMHPQNLVQGNHSTSYINGEYKLLDIIQKNVNTDFGEHYRFNNIKNIKGYRNRVPFSDCHKYSKLVRLQTNIGESDIFTEDELSGYVFEMNENSERCLLPFTKEYSTALGTYLNNELKGKTNFLMMSSLPRQKKLNDQTYINSIYGTMLTSAIGNFVRFENDDSTVIINPDHTLFPKKMMNTAYVNLLFALSNKNIEQIIAPNTAKVIEYVDILYNEWPTLCSDIANGTISRTDDIPYNILKNLQNQLVPDRKRAEELQRIFVKLGKNNRIVCEIWPELKRIVARSGGRYKVYTDRIKDYSENIQLVSGALILLPGMVGLATDKLDEYELNVDDYFYEFIPVVNEEEQESVLISDLQEGGIYEMVVTSRSGLYRYKTGVHISIISRQDDKVIFKEVGSVSIVNEGMKIYDFRIHEALTSGMEDNLLYDFAYGVDKEDVCLNVYVELRNPVGAERLEQQVEKYLLENAHLYKKAREKGTVSPCRVFIVENGTNRKVAECSSLHDGYSADAYSPIRFLLDETACYIYDNAVIRAAEGMNFISVDDLEIAGQGRCSDVYRLNEDLLIKVFKANISGEDMQEENDKIKEMRALGLPFAASFNLVKTEKGVGMLLEKINAETMQNRMIDRPKEFEAYTVRLAKLLKSIHSNKYRGDALPSAQEVFKERLKLAKKYLSDEEWDKIKQLINKIPYVKNIVHGDFHPGNILFPKDSLIMIDAADVMVGHPLFDLLLLYAYMVGEAKSADELLIEVESMGDSVQKDQLKEKIMMMKNICFAEEKGKEFWDIFIRAYLETDDKERIDEVNAMLKGYAYLVEVFAYRTEEFMGEDMVRLLTEHGVKNLIARMDTLECCL